MNRKEIAKRTLSAPQRSPPSANYGHYGFTKARIRMRTRAIDRFPKR
jgi:hypothetical protein